MRLLSNVYRAVADVEEKVKGMTGADVIEGKDAVTREEMVVKGRSMAQIVTEALHIDRVKRNWRSRVEEQHHFAQVTRIERRGCRTA